MRRPLWRETVTLSERPALEGRATADVCVIGAGIAGLTTAYQLARDGRTVIVLEDGAIAGGQSERTTAHLSNAIDDRYERIASLHGHDAARLAADSHTQAIDHIEQIVESEGIACGFARVDGFLVQAPQAPRNLEAELAAATGAGLIGLELLDRSPVPGLGGPCIRFPRQGQFQPLEYLTGLAAAAERHGARIHCGSHVVDIQGQASVCVRTESGASVRAGHAVVATNSPIHTWVALHTKQFAYRTFVVALDVEPAAVPRALYWDNLDPYHYVRTHREPGSHREILIAGGEDERIGPLTKERARSRYARLEEWTRKHFPGVGSLHGCWSGEVLEPVDGLAFIGRTPGDSDAVYLATGDSGMGLTHGTIAGMLLADLLAGRSNPWTELYDPARKSLSALPQFLRGNLGTAVRYGDWLEPSLRDPQALRPGMGAVVRRGLRELAVYRDDAGELHVFSARCRHLGGRVGWNADDATWDCPCHGARYDAFGRVIQGPANADLERVAEKIPTQKKK
jgi:glycine/D-amino acid oxidase-like deaminating enzyme/nitrite reductase/ring-hydroxylating ferredoxin subunit